MFKKYWNNNSCYDYCEENWEEEIEHKLIFVIIDNIVFCGYL